MKICKYCGTEYDDGLDNCPNCGGNKVFSARELEEEANQQQKEIENQERAAAAPIKKKNTIIGVIVAVVVVIAAIAGFSIYKANQPLSNGMTKDEAQGVFDNGVAFMDAGQYEDAIDTFLQLPSDSKQYTEAQELLAQSQDSYRADIISRVDSQVANGDYDSAFSLVEKAQSILPGDVELQNAYDNTYTAYRTAVLAKADEYSQSGQYKMALEYLAGVQATFSDDAQIQEAYDSINLAYKEQIRTTAIVDADNYVANADYVSAINTLSSAISEIGQDEEITAKLNIVSNDYATSVIDAAKAQYVEYDINSIQAAQNIISDALSVLPDNTALAGEFDFYADVMPVDAVSLPDTLFGRGRETRLEDHGAITDNQDVVHNRSYNGYTADDYWGCNFDVDYQYTRFTGMLFQSKDYALSPVVTTIEVYGFTTSDWYSRTLLWSGTVDGNSLPVTFNVDISGYKTVRIELDQDNLYKECYSYLTDLYAWK